MSRERILVVDDEPTMTRAVERVLASRYEVAAASTADDALEQARSLRPDLAILDIRMPLVDGFELLSRLRAVDPGLDVIFMTGVVHELDAQLIRSIREKAFYFIQKPFDREVLLTLVQRCLELRRLAEANRQHVERLEGELREARSFQRSLLPPASQILEGVAIAARWIPSAELGGDLFDYAASGDGRVTVLVADVSGHGVSAAMLTALVKAAFHDAREEAHDPSAVVRRVARAIRSFEMNRFVSLVCAQVCPRDGTLAYVNAGHPAGLLSIAGSEPRRLEATGPIVSPAFPDFEWQVRRVELRPHERLLLYTDGITEARGEEGFFEERRLIEALGGSAASGETLLRTLMSAVRSFSGGRPPEDDQTLLTLHREGES